LLDDDVIDDSLDENDGTEGARTRLFANHTGDGDCRVEEFVVQKHVMHFLGKRIDQRNRLNVEICLLIKAGTSDSNERSTTTEFRNRMMLDR
jgi:hypothetical protein